MHYMKRFGSKLIELWHSKDTQAAHQLYRSLRQQKLDLKLPPGIRFQMHIWKHGERLQKKSGRCVLSIHDPYLEIYPHSRHMDKPLRFNLKGLCWFNRPRLMYQNGRAESLNEIELHLHDGDRWFRLRITGHDEDLDKLHRTIKELAPIYHRPHAYTPFAKVRAYPAFQDLQGAWEISRYQATLFLSPFELIVWIGNRRETYPLAEISHVAALRRLDQSMARGLVRFNLNKETVAFTINNYEEFAIALAEMADVQLEWSSAPKYKR